MRVQVGRDRGRRVPKPIADDLQINARGQGETGVRVPQVVEADLGNGSPIHELSEPMCHGVGPEQAAVGPREDQAEVLPCRAPAHTFPILLLRVAMQHLGCPGVDRYDAGAGRCLRCAEARSVAGVGDLRSDDQVSSFEIDVFPVEADRLAASQARECDEVEQRG